MRAAGRTEFAVHHIAAVGNTAIVAQLAADNERVARKAGIDRRAAGADVLTQTAPAHPRDNRRGADSIAHGLAQTATSNFRDESLCQSKQCRPNRVHTPTAAERHGARKYVSAVFID
jgi:phage gp37-like protein